MGISKNFVVRNGLEVADNLLYASDETNRVGINTAIPEYEFEVIGDTRLDGAIVSSGDTSGISGQYIKSTGTGWEWDTFPRNRQAEKYTLVASQTRIPATGQFPSFTLVEYELTSVYLDGVKLTSGDYVINPGGDSISLFAAAFGGEEVEIIAHGATSVGTGNTGILGISVRESGISTGDPGRIQILDFVGLGVTLSGRTGLVTAYIDSGGLSDVQSDPAPLLGGFLGLNNKGIYGTGIITATGFVGDGSELTGITTLIKAGSNVNVTTFNGITTIGANVPEGQGFFSNDQTNLGIHTSSTHVGLGTTNPRFQTEIGPVGYAGTSLWVNGDARITGILTVGSSSVTIDGINDEIRIGTSLTITSDGSAQYTGIVTASGFDGDLVGQHKIFTAGVSNSDDYTIAMFLNPTQGGHSFARYDLGGKLQYNPSTGQLSNVGIISATGSIISGVSTHQGIVNFQSDVNFGDNNAINIGSGNDLSLYHDGVNSYIDDSGDGDLILRGNGAVRIRRYTTEEMGVFNANGSVDLYYDNSKKFETTSAGVDITGTLNVNDDITIVGSSPTVKLQDTDASQNYAYLEFDTSLDHTLFLRSRAFSNTPNFRYQSEAGGSIDTDDIFTVLGTGDGSRTHFVGVNSSNPEQRLTVGGNIKASDLLLASRANISGVATASEVHTGTVTAQGLDNLVLSADNANRYVQAEGIILNKSRQIYGNGGDIRILGGGGQTSRPNLYLGNGNQCILDAGSGSTFGLSLKGGGSNGTVRVDEGNFKVGAGVEINYSAGVVTAVSFIGDGSGLSGVTAVGSGVSLQNNGSNIGVAATINFGTNLDVTAISAGIVTVSGVFSLVDDTTPQLGGDLDLNSRTINGTGNINITGVVTATSFTVWNDIGSNEAWRLFHSNNVLDPDNGNAPIGNGLFISPQETANPQDGIYFQTYESGQAQRSLVVKDNKVGVGTTNATEKLTVDGNITATGFVTATTYYGDGSNLTGISAGGGGTGYFDNNQTNPGIHTTAAHVGLGTTNPRTPLQVEEVYGVYTDYGNFSATAGVTTDGDASWVIATDDFKTAEYTLWFQYNENIQSQKVLVMNDGTTAYSQEYAIMYNNDLLISVGATISSGTCKLQWTPETGVTGVVTYRVVRETML